MSIFSIFLEIAPALPEVFENIFLSRYLTNPYPTRSKIQTCFKGLRPGRSWGRHHIFPPTLKFRPALRD